MDDPTRFDRVRRTTAYRTACLEAAPAPSLRVSGVIAMAALLVPLVFVLAVARPVAAAITGATALAALGALVGSLILERRTPVNRQLAIVAATWTGLRGSARNQRVARSVTLRDAYGIERDFRLAGAAVGDALEGAIGLATIRRGTVIRFVDLDPAG